MIRPLGPPISNKTHTTKTSVLIHTSLLKSKAAKLKLFTNIKPTYYLQGYVVATFVIRSLMLTY